MDLLVGDTTSPDKVWRLVDWNQDGDYNDPGEAVKFYDESNGTLPLSTPAGIASLSDGRAILADLGTDTIITLEDQNGDGDAEDAGEHVVFFDLTNASGVEMYTMNAICVDQLDRVFVTNANSGAGGIDAIYVLQDNNGDGDAQDAGEASEYFAVPNATGATADANPFDICIGPDGNIYFVDNADGSPIAKGIYRLEDLDMDGDCNDAGENTLFWEPGQSMNFLFFRSLAVDQDGYFYTGEYTDEDVIWRGRDDNGDGVIDDTEENVFYNPPTGLWNDIAVRADGSIVLAEDQTPDRIIVLTDNNGDGDADDPGESVEAYDDTVSATEVRATSITFMRAPTIGLLPSIVQVGNFTNMLVRTATPLDLAAVFLSVSVLPTPVDLAPFGQIEVDANQFLGIGFGLSDADGGFPLPFAIPNDPAAVGTYGVQALCGDDFRLFLSDGRALIVTP